VAGVTASSLALSAIVMFIIPWDMRTGPSDRGEASLLGNDPVFGLYMLFCVLACVTGTVTAFLLIRKRRTKASAQEPASKNFDQENI
jgi:hypothetical protein